MKRFAQVLLRAKESSDVVLAAGVAVIIGALVVPLPDWLLDLGIALNLAAALALLVAALHAREALRLASFPTLLLLTTLFRVALNVSSTRLALSEGHAGKVIEAFGEFVVRGDYVVGTVLFAILTLVQFLVVAKGAERVAEVSARFTLDAMPGKQMSIDADLRAGAIDQAQARTRRRALERESQLFGAMDGAMKFVKGDVVAGLVIVLINLLGGTAIGALQHGMTWSDAASTYALIAVGDGLVSQLPSLCIAIAAGLMVTRVSSESDDGSLGSDIGAQLFGEWKPLLVVAVLCFCLGLMPGMPHLIFAALSLGMVLLGLGLRHLAIEKGTGGRVETEAGPPAEGVPEAAPAGVSRLTLDLSAEVSALTHLEQGRWVSEGLAGVREQLFQELGVRIPSIRVRTGASYLRANSYCLLLDEVPCGRGEVDSKALYALLSPPELLYLGVAADPVNDPSTGRLISRVDPSARGRLEAAKIEVQTPGQMVCSHLKWLLRRRAAAFVGVQEVQALLTSYEEVAPALVREVTAKIPLPLLSEVFRALVAEEVSVRDVRGVLEALAAPRAEGNAHALADICRQALQSYLSHKFAPHGPLYAHLVDPAVEELFRADPAGVSLEPARVNALLEAVGRIAAEGKAVLLTSADVRRPLKRLCESAFPEVAVLAYGELDAQLQVRPLGRLTA